MMKTRNLLILAVVLVALLGISLLQRAQHSERTGRSATEAVVAGEFTAEGLGRIVLGQGERPEAVVLSSGPDGWIVETAWNVAASSSRIDALLRGLNGLRGEFRSDDAGVLPDYGLDDSTAVHIRVADKNGQEVIALEVGNKSTRTPGNFVRHPGANRVFLSDKSVSSLLGLYGEPEPPQNRFFLELAAVKEDRLDIDRMSLRDGDVTLEFAKEFLVPEPDEADTATVPGPDRTTWEWTLVGGGATTLAKTKVDAVLNSLVNIRATDVDDPGGDAVAYGLDAPSRSATLVRADGTAITLLFGGERAAEGDRQAGTWMRIEGEPTVWVVTDYTVKNVFKSLDELQPE